MRDSEHFHLIFYLSLTRFGHEQHHAEAMNPKVEFIEWGLGSADNRECRSGGVRSLSARHRGDNQRPQEAMRNLKRADSVQPRPYRLILCLRQVEVDHQDTATEHD